jgi:hypothetical protein
LIAFDRITGTLETYIDALGRKSLAPPNRRRLDLETRSWCRDGDRHG